MHHGFWNLGDGKIFLALFQTNQMRPHKELDCPTPATEGSPEHVPMLTNMCHAELCSTP